MIPEQYTEVVSVAGVPPYTESSCVSYVDQEGWERWKETVDFGPGLCPHAFRSSMIVLKDCTKKRFINRVEYETRLKPKTFSQTHFTAPKESVHTYVSFLDFHVDGTRKWYKSTVDLKPKTYSSTKVHNFEYRKHYNNNEGEVNVSDEEDIEEDEEKEDYRAVKHSLVNGSPHTGIHLNGDFNSLSSSTMKDVKTSVKSGPFVYGPPKSPVLNGFHSNQRVVNGEVNGFSNY